MTVRRGDTFNSLEKTGAPKLNRGMFSSASDEWETPQKFFDVLDAVFHFTLDVCATSDNAKCECYYTREDDGLSLNWKGACWMNPPYGREISLWVRKAYESSLEGETVVVCLLPARTDTGWWHDYVLNRAERIWFIRGRLRFSGKGSAPFPSALVVFGRPFEMENFEMILLEGFK
ncbi:MAG: phage N-6-adenine-methyltransferase [Synergistaceae bacterium]|jgi:phage N-6-adenine-methyltransferase|nr:phage N-6-adenine-methyltransferase [Synergistaceae bacterium]